MTAKRGVIFNKIDHETHPEIWNRIAAGDHQGALKASPEVPETVHPGEPLPALPPQYTYVPSFDKDGAFVGLETSLRVYDILARLGGDRGRIDDIDLAVSEGTPFVDAVARHGSVAQKRRFRDIMTSEAQCASIPRGLGV